MDEINYFIIEGTKSIIFRKENDEFIFFDPYALEYYSVDFIGAEILYLISQNITYKDIVEHFINEYDLQTKYFEEVFYDFLKTFPLLNSIYINLIQLDIIKGVNYETAV